MSLGMHKSTKVHLMVDGKYVKARKSKDSKVELFLVDEQGDPDSVECCTYGQSTEGLTKKYVAFNFKHESECYSLHIVEGTLTLVESARPVNGSCSSVHDWLEMVDIKAGERYRLRTTAGLIGSCMSKLCVQDSPVIFVQVPNS